MSTTKNKFTKKDFQYMNLALNLARARHGLTGTNPSVGCVIVKNDQIISIGQTSYNGRPHAEYNALRNSYEKLKGAKMYITLEPCNHYGQTQPCTNKIIKSKISEVFYSINDIDKKVSGKSFKILKSKNILVKKNLLKNKVFNFYKPYFFNRKNKVPYVTGKIAMSKNDLIYNQNKTRITDTHSDQLTHFLRYKNDSLMISSKTLNIDNPRLTCRLKKLNRFSPKRVILDKNLEMKITSYIFKTVKKENTIVFYNYANKSKILAFKKKGINLIKMDLNKKKHFNLKLILKKLYILGCRNLLVEGGNNLTNSFLKSRFFNEFYLFRSPNNLSKATSFKNFNSFSVLSKNYKNKSIISTMLGKDSITLYNK